VEYHFQHDCVSGDRCCGFFVGLALYGTLGDVCRLGVRGPVWNHFAARAAHFAVDLLENLLETKGNARPELIPGHRFDISVT
jgi:hypothetical protein